MIKDYKIVGEPGDYQVLEQFGDYRISKKRFKNPQTAYQHILALKGNLVNNDVFKIHVEKVAK